MVEARIKITGSVQGVFYRSFARDMATKLQIKGWVKNEPDGSVSICAQGARESIQDFAGFLKKGPPGANVAKVDMEWNAFPSEKLASFETRR